jgi:hypothetical protein
MGGSCHQLVVLITPLQVAGARHEVPGRPGVLTFAIIDPPESTGQRANGTQAGRLLH